MLMMFRELSYIYSENHMKAIEKRRGKTVEFINVKAGGIYSNHCASSH
jgi:hypothetical protein